MLRSNALDGCGQTLPRLLAWGTLAHWGMVLFCSCGASGVVMALLDLPGWALTLIVSGVGSFIATFFWVSDHYKERRRSERQRSKFRCGLLSATSEETRGQIALKKLKNQFGSLGRD